MFRHQQLQTSKRSEEHTSELQSPCNLVCRLLLEKKKKTHRKSQYKVKHSRRPSSAMECASSHALTHSPVASQISFCTTSAISVFFFFFFNYSGTPGIYPFSLHDALPI